jgi:hypothetical protein
MLPYTAVDMVNSMNMAHKFVESKPARGRMRARLFGFVAKHVAAAR